MAYDVSPRLFLEDGPAIHSARVRARSSASRSQSIWAFLDAKQRLAVVECQLRDAA